MPGVLAMAQAMLGIGFAAGVFGFLLKGQMPRAVAIVCGSIAVLAAVLVLLPMARRCARTWFTAQVVAYAVLIIVLLGAQRPDVENQRSSREFAAALAQYLHASDYRLLVHQLPEDLAVYLPLDLQDAGNAPYALLAVDHSAKSPPETLESLSKLLGDARVTEMERLNIGAPDGHGRWQLFQIRIDRTGVRI
jgi:hypothetical protein